MHHLKTVSGLFPSNGLHNPAGNHLCLSRQNFASSRHFATTLVIMIVMITTKMVKYWMMIFIPKLLNITNRWACPRASGVPQFMNKILWTNQQVICLWNTCTCLDLETHKIIEDVALDSKFNLFSNPKLLSIFSCEQSKILIEESVKFNLVLNWIQCSNSFVPFRI